MSIPVFRNGTWIQYDVSSSMNPLWSKSHIFQAASFYATARAQGLNPSDSSVFAEAYVNKLIYPGIEYSRSLEDTLKRIMDCVETA